MKPNYRYNCNLCKTPCDGKSKGSYIFNSDVTFSEHFEQRIINYYNNLIGYKAIKSSENKYPDLMISKEKSKHFFIEVKVQRRTFMSVAKKLPNSNLIPSETIALNRSDLERYFKISENDKSRIYILWVILNRPCILQNSDYKIFVQNLEKLKAIYKKEKNNRTFHRKSGKGDIVNGVHKGVVVNYHFSLNELKELKIKI